jgi:hypothetical protein
VTLTCHSSGHELRAASGAADAVLGGRCLSDFDRATHHRIVALDTVLQVLEKAAKKKPIPCEPYQGSALAYRATLGELTLRARLNLLEQARTKLSAAAMDCAQRAISSCQSLSGGSETDSTL